jgi:para-nitrobenzyl esterase
VPLLIGATANEMTTRWMADERVTLDMVRAALAKAGLTQPHLDRYLRKNAGLRPGELAGQAMTDRTFRVPAQELAAAKAATGGPAYVYDFRWGSPVDGFGGLAIHCLDIPFAFDTLTEQGVSDVAGDAPPAALAAGRHGAWVRFVTGGEPGWSRYDAGPRPVMVFSQTSATQHDPLQAEREAWSGVIARSG